MTAVLKSSAQNRPFPSRQVAANRGSNVALFAPPAKTRRERQQLAKLQPKNRSTPSRSAVVRALPASRSMPSWLRLLLVAHRGSSIVTFLLITAVLTIYGWTVQTQQIWGREYSRLEDLQRQERQIITANEVLKDNIALQAEDPASGSVAPTPDNAVYLDPAPLRPARAIAPAAAVDAPVSTGPLGY